MRLDQDIYMLRLGAQTRPFDHRIPFKRGKYGFEASFYIAIVCGSSDSKPRGCQRQPISALPDTCADSEQQKIRSIKQYRYYMGSCISHILFRFI